MISSECPSVEPLEVIRPLEKEIPKKSSTGLEETGVQKGLDTQHICPLLPEVISH